MDLCCRKHWAPFYQKRSRTVKILAKIKVSGISRVVNDSKSIPRLIIELQFNFILNSFVITESNRTRRRQVPAAIHQCQLCPVETIRISSGHRQIEPIRCGRPSAVKRYVRVCWLAKGVNKFSTTTTTRINSTSTTRKQQSEQLVPHYQLVRQSVKGLVMNLEHFFCNRNQSLNCAILHGGLSGGRDLVD